MFLHNLSSAVLLLVWFLLVHNLSSFIRLFNFLEKILVSFLWSLKQTWVVYYQDLNHQYFLIIQEILFDEFSVNQHTIFLFTQINCNYFMIFDAIIQSSTNLLLTFLFLYIVLDQNQLVGSFHWSRHYNSSQHLLVNNIFWIYTFLHHHCH